MKTTIVIDGTLTLYSFIDRDTCERVTKVAQLPAAIASDWEGDPVHIIDWKINAGVVTLTYQMRNDAYAPIFEHQFPLVDIRTPMQPPTRSKNWKLDPYQDEWRNSKTGARAYA